MESRKENGVDPVNCERTRRHRKVLLGSTLRIDVPESYFDRLDVRNPGLYSGRGVYGMEPSYSGRR